MYHHRAAFNTTSGFFGGCSLASPRVIDFDFLGYVVQFDIT